MKPIRTVSLTLWLPVLVSGLFFILWSITTWMQYQDSRSDLIASSLSFVNKDMAVLQREMEKEIARGHRIEAGQSLMSRGVETRYRELAAVDDKGLILYANRFAMRGHQAGVILPDFDSQRFVQRLSAGRPDVRFDPARWLIVGYFPMTLERAPGEIRPLRQGMIFAVFDLANDHARLMQHVWRASLPLALLLILTILALVGFLHYFVRRPLIHLVSVSQALAAGESGVFSDVRGRGGLARLATAFNEMSSQMELRAEQRNAAQKTLQESQTKSARAEKIAKMGFLDWDLKKNEVEFSENAIEIYGLELDKKSVSVEFVVSLIHPEDRENVQHHLRLAVRGGEAFDVDYRIVRPDGKVLYVHGQADLACDDEGKPVAMMGTVIDITERKKVEAALLQQDHIVSSTTDMLALLDKQLVYRSVNVAYLDAFGLTLSEVIGHTPAAVFGEDHFNKVIKPYAERCLAGEDIHYQRWAEFPVIGRKFLDVLYVPFRGPEGEIEGFVVTGRDITASQKLQEQLLQSQKMDSIGRLAGGLAHDFNNMLGVILGNAEIALEGVDSSQPIHAELLEIHKAASRSADLTQQLLAFARQQTIAPSVLDLNNTVDSMIEMLRRLIGENIELSWQPVSGLWPVKMDPSQVDQILANLCANARDAINDVGKVLIEMRNTSFDQAYCENDPMFAVGDYVLLAVSDDGRGIDSETLSRIYEPFFTTKELGQGTGLGLAMVYGIVQQNGGFIHVRSTVGIGTFFEVYLPRHFGTASQPREVAAAEPAIGGDETILVVEDEPAILQLTETMLKRLGYTVLVATTPGQAMRLAKAHAEKIDLLLTDVIMPEMNGRDLARNLSSVAPQLKHLYMSGYTADVISKKGILGEDMQFIQKPFSQQELAAKVVQALAIN